MSRGSDVGKGVRFADSSIPSSIPPSTPATSAAVDCRLGFLLVGGVYASDLFTIDAPSSTHDDQLSEPQPEARGLTASNLSVGVEPGASSGQRRVVLRLWADREGPFEARFALGLPPDQEVQVHVTATVFNRKKGTPGLKPHVRCLGFSADTDTEASSDWPGFA